MVISEHDASAFIHGYTQLMVEIHGRLPAKRKPRLFDVLAAAREEYMADRSLLDEALGRLAGKSVSIPNEVISAIRSPEVEKWNYLKDTRAYSVFIHPSGHIAYGVLGLTERIKDITGSSGAIIQIGVVRYLGRYVTDGIVSNVVWLGPNYKKDFTGLLTRLRNQGAFHVSYVP